MLSQWGEAAQRIIPEFNSYVQEEENTPIKERKCIPSSLNLCIPPYFRVNVKTIYHEISKNTRRKQLLSRNSRQSPIGYLFSFELKINLHFGNLREVFFQAISNFSWANEGYLAAVNFQKDPDLMNELAKISKTFGIGILGLDPSKPEESETLFQSNPKSELDFDTIYRIAEDNGNFKDLLRNIVENVKFGKVKSEYDRRSDGNPRHSSLPT
ncbi:hypothetical protein EHO60_16080 [Leptospira fletcheri]|uniref:HrgA protein n=2 Tax=Leptospira fletcheri TaxID=2484981 RepID=A0A4R9G6F1_9LEPT|nr:hypothetical protein EHO60_16080 [Leptospira fletcheri]